MYIGFELTIIIFALTSFILIISTLFINTSAKYKSLYNILFVINNIPELRNLKKYKFESETKIIKNFSEVNGIKFIDSFEILKNHQEETLWVTKYDSHANDKAHLLIAKFLKKKLFNELNSLY